MLSNIVLGAGLLPLLALGASIPARAPIAECTKTYTLQAGDLCWDLMQKYGFTYEELLSWNTDLDCSNLEIGQDICIEVPGSPIQVGPSPQREGTSPNCTDFYQLKAGDSCASVDKMYGITLEQLIEWNTSIDKDCTNLWAGYYICVKA